jgi:hypothetical protein
MTFTMEDVLDEGRQLCHLRMTFSTMVLPDMNDFLHYCAATHELLTQKHEGQVGSIPPQCSSVMANKCLIMCFPVTTTSLIVSKFGGAIPSELM